MAKTILESFKELKVNLGITDLQHSTVSTRQQRVRKAIKQEMNMIDSFLTGSYLRHTMIASLKNADIDIFIVIDSRVCKGAGIDT